MGFPGGANSKEPAYQFRGQKRCRFDPWVGKIPWRRKWQPTPVFLPGESHGRRSVVVRHKGTDFACRWHTCRSTQQIDSDTSGEVCQAAQHISNGSISFASNLPLPQSLLWVAPPIGHEPGTQESVSLTSPPPPWWGSQVPGPLPPSPPLSHHCCLNLAFQLGNLHWPFRTWAVQVSSPPGSFPKASSDYYVIVRFFFFLSSDHKSLKAKAFFFPLVPSMAFRDGSVHEYVSI